MPGYGGHVPFRPWTIGRRHMSYGSPASRGGVGGDGGGALRGSGLKPPNASRHYDDTEQSTATGRGMRKGGYADAAGRVPPRADPEPAARSARYSPPPTPPVETPPYSQRDGGDTERSGAETTRARSRVETERSGAEDDSSTRAAGRQSMIAREEHPDAYMPPPARGEHYQRYQSSEQPRGKINARSHYEATKQPVGGRMQNR